MSTLRRLCSTAVVTGALAGTTALALPASPAAAASACETDCVTMAVAVGPEAATINVTSAANVRAAVKYRRLDDNGNGVGTVSTLASSTFSTSRSWSLTNLPQATVYAYTLIATDYTGASWQETGSFTTAQRNVTVTLTSLHVEDDSDVTNAGDLLGGAHLNGACGDKIKPLDPLFLTDTQQVSSGTTLALSPVATITCGKVPASLSLESMLVDDDREYDHDDCDDVESLPWTWPATTWVGKVGTNRCTEWNSGAGAFKTTLGAGSLGTQSVPVAHSETGELFLGNRPLEWDLKGTATFTHVVPSRPTPTPSSGPLTVQLKAVPQDGGMQLSWTTPEMVGTSIDGYRVSYRPAGGSWTSVSLGVVTSHVVTGLKNGTSYEFRVALRDTTGVLHARSAATGTPVLLPSTFTQWSTETASVSPGGQVTASAQVSATSPRPVHLQTRPARTTTWQTVSTLTTTGNGLVGAALPYKTGTHEWRLSAPKTATHAAAVSAPRTITGS